MIYNRFKQVTHKGMINGGGGKEKDTQTSS
jgi:hypothetical protein